MTFEDAIRAAGMEPRKIIPGKMARFPGIGKKRGESGWAILFEDQKAGVFGDWSTGLNEKWIAGKDVKVDREAIREAQRRRENEKRKGELAAADKAWRIVKQEAIHYIEGDAIHPYAGRKRLLHWWTWKGNVVVPMYRSNALVNVQLISADGSKKFLTGGAVKGAYSRWSAWAQANGERTFMICEGYATGSSLSKMFPEREIVCAMSCWNLLQVAELFGNHYSHKIIIAGDDDRFTPGNLGRKHAEACAKAMGCEVIFPEFPEGCDGTDFNDVEVFNAAAS